MGQKGRVLKEGLAGAVGQLLGELESIVVLAILARAQTLLRIPVVGRFVVVPGSDQGDGSMERQDVLIEQVVEVIATEVIERGRRFGFGFGGDVFPDRAIMESQFRWDRVVGIDHIPAVHKEIGSKFFDRRVDLHPAPFEIDTESLARCVSRPSEEDILGAVVWGSQLPSLRIACASGVFEGDLVVDFRARRESS